MTRLPVLAGFDRRQREGVALLLAAVAGYSFFSVWVRAISATGLSALDLATWRFVLTVPILWGLLALRGPRSASKRSPSRVGLLVAGALMAVGALSAIFGIQRGPVSLFLLVFYTYPAMVALLSLALGERLGAAGWAALGVTLAGIALTIPDIGDALRGGVNSDTVALALVNALSVALFYLVSSRVMRGVTDTPRGTAWTITGTLICFVVVVPFRTVELPASPGAWLLLAGMAALSTALPVVCLQAAIQRLGAPRTAILGTLELVLALLWSVVLLGERLLPAQLAGGALIFAGVVLLQVRHLRPRTPDLPPIPADAPPEV